MVTVSRKSCTNIGKTIYWKQPILMCTTQFKSISWKEWHRVYKVWYYINTNVLTLQGHCRTWAHVIWGSLQSLMISDWTSNKVKIQLNTVMLWDQSSFRPPKTAEGTAFCSSCTSVARQHEDTLDIRQITASSSVGRITSVKRWGHY